MIQESRAASARRTASSAAVAKVPSTPSERIGHERCGTGASRSRMPPSNRITIKRDDADPLDRHERDRSCRKLGHEVRRGRRGDEEERRARDREPLGQRPPEERERRTPRTTTRMISPKSRSRPPGESTAAPESRGRTIQFPYMDLTARHTRRVDTAVVKRTTLVLLTLLALSLPVAGASRAERRRWHALGRGRPRQSHDRRRAAA